MSFSDVSDLLLTYIVTYGAVVLSAVFLAAAVGLAAAKHALCGGRRRVHPAGRARSV